MDHAGSQLLMVGVDHQRASLDELGRAAVRRDALPQVLTDLRRSLGDTEVVVLSTCSRTEVYTTAQGDAGPRVAQVLDWITGWSGLARPRVEGASVVLSRRDAVAHLFRVAAGLESRLLGDVDVVAQVRHAWRTAQDSGTTGPLTDRLFAQSLRCARQVHTGTGLGQQSRSLAKQAVDVGLAVARASGSSDPGWTRPAQLEVLVVGSGQMASVACEHLSTLGQSPRVAARDRAYAARLAGEARACSLSDLVEEVQRADLVLCATSAPHGVLRVEHVEQAMPARHRPLTVVDLGVPGNVEAGVRDLTGVRLVDLADLGDDASQAPETAAILSEAGRVALASAHKFSDDLAAAGAGPVIQAVRARVEEECSDVLRRHVAAAGPHAHTDAVHAIVGKIMHRPTLMARAAAAAGDRNALVLLCEAFGVTADDVLLSPTASVAQA